MQLGKARQRTLVLARTLPGLHLTFSRNEKFYRSETKFLNLVRRGRRISRKYPILAHKPKHKAVRKEGILYSCSPCIEAKTSLSERVAEEVKGGVGVLRMIYVRLGLAGTTDGCARGDEKHAHRGIMCTGIITRFTCTSSAPQIAVFTMLGDGGRKGSGDRCM